MPQARPEPTASPVALFVFSNLREQKGGLTRAWLRRLTLFHEAGWETHVATIHFQPEIDETLTAWRERGWLPNSTKVHHYQRRSRRFRASWTRPTDDQFTRDDRIADWLDWLVGLLPGVLVFADSPVTYAPVAKMRNPYIGRVMTVHLGHRTKPRRKPRRPAPSAPQRSRYQGPAGQPKLTDRFLPFAARADAVVALTRRQAQHLTEDLPGLIVHVIPNIVDLPEAATAGTERDRHRVVSMGRLDPLKRIDDAVRAVALARVEVPDLRLDIYGRGPDLDRLLALCDELGVRQAVSFLGFTERPYARLAAARASLMTSRREGFGLAVAESLAVGTPVVTYDVDYGPAELVADGVNGRVVPDGDVQRLARALTEVVTDDAAWARMSAAGPPAVAHLGHERVASAWLDLAAEVAQAVPVPGPSLLVEDLRARRAGAQILGVAFAVGGRGPRTVTVAGAAHALEPSEEWQSAGTRSKPGGAMGGPLTVSAVSATVPWPDVAGILGPARGAADKDGSAELLVALGDGADPVPVSGPGLPRTILPTPAGLVVVHPGPNGVLGAGPAGSVVDLVLTSGSAEVDLGGDLTPLGDSLLLQATIIPDRSPRELAVRCLVPGLDLPAGSELSLLARGETARVVGSVALSTDHRPTGPRDSWQGRGFVTWQLEALADPTAASHARLDLGVTVGRQIRSVGHLVGRGRPVPVTLAGARWVMATSSNGRLLLVRGRALRTRVGWAVRRALPGRARI